MTLKELAETIVGRLNNSKYADLAVGKVIDSDLLQIKHDIQTDKPLVKHFISQLLHYESLLTNASYGTESEMSDFIMIDCHQDKPTIYKWVIACLAVFEGKQDSLKKMISDTCFKFAENELKEIIERN